MATIGALLVGVVTGVVHLVRPYSRKSYYATIIILMACATTVVVSDGGLP